MNDITGIHLSWVPVNNVIAVVLKFIFVKARKTKDFS